MAFNIRISNFTPINNLVHIATSYQIATDALGTNVVHALTKSTAYVNLYPAPINPILGDTYWVRFKRHYKDNITTIESEGDWSSYKSFTPTISTSDLILYNEIYIEKPLITIDKSSLLETSNVIKIATTDFRCSSDSHLETHWVITDIFGNTLYTKLSSSNLLSLEVNKQDIIYNSRSSIVIYVIHRSASGIESEAGKSTITIDNSNFEISSSLQRVIPYSNYTVKLAKVNSNIVLKTVKYELIRVDSEDEPLIQKDMEYDTISFTLQGELLESNSKYYLDVYTIGTDSKLNRKRKVLETLAINKPYSIDTEYKYKKQVVFVKDIPIASTVTDKFTVYENSNGVLPMCKINDIKLYQAKYNRNTEVIDYDGLKTYPAVSLVTGDNDEIFIKMLDKSILFIDSFINNIPTFSLYRYNAYDNTMLLISTLPRPTETKCLGRTNSLVVKGEDIYYIPYGSKDINKFNIVSNTIVKETTISNITTVSKNLTLLEVNRNRLLVLGGDTTKTYSYNLETKEILEAFPFPATFRNKEIKSVSLRNGDGLIFVSDSTGTVNTMLYYDYFNNSIEDLVPTPLGNFHPDSVIVLSTGEVLLLVNGTTYTSYYKLV